jgi:6-phosphogluconolactonase
MSSVDLEILADASAVADRAVELMRETIERAITERGKALVALSGGSTPGETYRRYAAGGAPPEARWYFVDERCVSPDSERSNYAAARADLFLPAQIPDSSVFRMEGERNAEEAARDYARILCEAGGVQLEDAIDEEGRSRVKLDLVISGMGGDGHTASLFPGTGAVYRHHELVTVVEPGQGLELRITLTRPVLIGARRVLVLVTGESKRAPLGRALAEGSEDEIPSRLYRKAEPNVVSWLIDQSAKP